MAIITTDFVAYTASKMLDKAKRNYQRALTNHNKQQSIGETDMSVKQTRRMALAVSALSRASFRLHDCERVMLRLLNQR
jgi:hypothetical protein